MEVTEYPGDHASLAAGYLEEVSLEFGFKDGLEESRHRSRMKGGNLSRGMEWAEVGRLGFIWGAPLHLLCTLPCPHRWAAGGGRSTAGGL